MSHRLFLWGFVQRIIIDGYNVLFADDRLRKAALRNRKQGRVAMIRAVTDYVRERDVKVTLVFDGRGTMVDADVVVQGKLQVVYSPDGETADDLILGTLRASARPSAYMVVSSDRVVAGEARAMGATAVGAKHFLDKLNASDATSTAGRGEREKPQPGQEDTDYWLTRFDEDVPDE